jgi:Ca2+-binding EF-hand superfamily protein
MNSHSARTLTAVALAVSIACASAFPLSASAGDKEGCSAGPTVTQDVEGGGYLNAASHKASAAKRFELMDSNRDGKVTADEISGSRGAESIAWASKLTSGAEKVAELDTNKDGALTANEYTDSSQKIFSKLDVDGDGVLSEAEMRVPFKGGAR